MVRFVQLLALLMLAPFGAHASAQGNSPSARLNLSPCTVPKTTEDGAAADEKVPARCGTFTVPEDRRTGRGRMLALKTIVIPSRSANPGLPIFIFAGGPGQATTDQAPIIAGLWHPQQHDVVFIDLRGTDRATGLDCGMEGSDDDPQSYLRPFLGAGAGYAKCRDKLSRRADLKQYTTSISVQDVDDLRKALGYSRINIEAGSYGTRAAIEYIRQFGRHVHAAALYSLVPPESRSPLAHASAAQRAYDQMVKQCEIEPACRAAYPNLKADVGTILRRLRSKPASVAVPHPATGAQVSVTLDDADFAGALRVMLYNIVNQRRIPLLLHRALAGDYTPFATTALQSNRNFAKILRVGLLFSVSCSEDAWRIRPGEPERESRGTFLGTQRVKGQLAACSVWPRGRVPAGFYDPPVSDVPVLLVSGNLDPVTPPYWGEVTQRRFRNALHVVVETGTHVPINPCLDEMQKRLFATGSLKGLDASCVNEAKAPPFALPDKS